jgi:hypothetical protein
MYEFEKKMFQVKVVCYTEIYMVFPGSQYLPFLPRANKQRRFAQPQFNSNLFENCLVGMPVGTPAMLSDVFFFIYANITWTILT